MKLLITMVLAVLVSGCGSGDGSGGDGPGSPPPAGNWYQPRPLTTWQWQLDGTVNITHNVQVYDIDLFDSSTTLIEQLHDNGRKVVCYFSAGSFEDWRPDAARFLAADKGGPVGGWPGEWWLDIRSANVRAIMRDRLDLAQQKGCDGVEPDWMDGYAHPNGLTPALTAADQLDYNRFLASEAHQRGLAIGLKNDLDQIDELVGYFDFAVNEQCFEFDECDALTPFIDANKAVFSTEYLGDYVTNAALRNAMCADSVNRRFSTLIMPVELDDAFRMSCL